MQLKITKRKKRKITIRKYIDIVSENSTGNENIVLKLFLGYQLEYYAYVARVFVFVCAALLLGENLRLAPASASLLTSRLHPKLYTKFGSKKSIITKL